MSLQDDLHERWLPSAEQMKQADALLSAGYTEERQRESNGHPVRERGVYTGHLLLSKEYGFWTESVELVFLDGVFLTREAVLEFVHQAAEDHHRKTGVKLTGGWAWHMGVGEAAVWEDISSQFPNQYAKPKAFLLWEDDLAVAFRPVSDRSAAMKFLVDNIEDEERFSAVYCELFADGTTWAEKVNPDHLEWLLDEEKTATCRHCDRTIVKVEDIWVDPEANGDDVVWRETCDAHDTFEAKHEP